MLDLANIVEQEIKATTPMCSVAGFDASDRVEDLATKTNKQLISKQLVHLKVLLKLKKP
jgi:hypothetical protein